MADPAVGAAGKRKPTGAMCLAALREGPKTVPELEALGVTLPHSVIGKLKRRGFVIDRAMSGKSVTYSLPSSPPAAPPST